jgi:hypothetical protein
VNVGQHQRGSVMGRCGVHRAMVLIVGRS